MNAPILREVLYFPLIFLMKSFIFFSPKQLLALPPGVRVDGVSSG